MKIISVLTPLHGIQQCDEVRSLSLEKESKNGSCRCLPFVSFLKPTSPTRFAQILEQFPVIEVTQLSRDERRPLSLEKVKSFGPLDVFHATCSSGPFVPLILLACSGARTDGWGRGGPTSRPLNLERGFDVEIINMSTGTVSPWRGSVPLDES